MPLALAAAAAGLVGGFVLSKGTEEISSILKFVVIGGAVFVAGKHLKVF